MELLEGESLARRMAREGTLSPPLAVDVVGQAASALGAAHARGVVHRDLKPDNLFLTRRGGRDPFVKILDFGIAKVVGGDRGGYKTRTGVIVGTPQYMAPEQCSGKAEIDGRADVYALGMILYQALCGRVAFDPGGFTDTLLAQLTQPVRSPRSWNP
jgi:serine/threonine-protein kinase